MEVSFSQESKSLRPGAGGYQGATVSHLLDVMVQAKPYKDVPTLDAGGLRSVDAGTWFGFSAPSGTRERFGTLIRVRNIRATEPQR